MARRTFLGRLRDMFSIFTTRRSKRAPVTFHSRTGETISVETDRRGFKKLNDVSTSRRFGRPPKPKKAGNVTPPSTTKQEEPQSQSASTLQSTSKPRSALADRTPPMKRKSQTQTLATKVRDSYSRFKETARASNLQLSDLFAGNQMLVHVTATPVSRARGTAKHYPSPGVGRRPVPAV